MSTGWDDRKQRTRADVINAVGEIIAADGLDGLTMRKLADRAGVAVATLYNQFGDRSGVLVAFVSSGLDRLERELDEQPDVGPIEATRTLIAGLEETFISAEPVWRPVLAALRSGTGIHGMGAVGERVIASVEADLAKAKADGLLYTDIDIDAVARSIFVQHMRGLERWAQGVIEWDLYRSGASVALELAFAAILVEPHRTNALRRARLAP